MKQEQLFFTIIIPTYNRPRQLAACLDAIAGLDYCQNRFEVVVVDDGGQRPLEDMIASYRNWLDITLVRQLNAGPATARNTGASQARGEFLVFTDDDCLPAPDWLQRLEARLGATPDHIIGGQIINALHNNPYSTTTQLLVSYLYDYYERFPNKVGFFATSNLAIANDHIYTIGGFDTNFPLPAGEDREFCDRGQTLGYRMNYAPEAIVYHHHLLTFRTFCRQHFNYGRGAFYFHQARAHRGQPGIKVEPLISFYLNLILYPFSRGQKRRGLLLSALMVITQGATAVGYFWEKMRHSVVKLQPKNGALMAWIQKHYLRSWSELCRRIGLDEPMSGKS